MEPDPGALQDPAVHLDLPVIRPANRRGGERVPNLGEGGTRPERLGVGTLVRDPVAALRRSEDRSSRRHDPFRGGHSLHRLVEVLVEGIPGIRSHDDLERLIHRTHGLPVGTNARLGVLSEQIAAECGGDPFVAVEEHVESEVHPHLTGNRPHVVVDGVALGDPEDRVRVTDARFVVEHQNRFQTGQPRRHHLRSSGKAREEMRFHEAGGDLDVRLQETAVEQHGDAVFGVRQPDELRVVPAVVVHHLASGEELASEHGFQFGGGGPAVRSGSNQQRHPFGRGRNLLEDGPQHRNPGLGAGRIAYRNRHRGSRWHPLGERRAGHRRPQNRGDRLLLGGNGCGEPGPDDGRPAGGRR